MTHSEHQQAQWHQVDWWLGEINQHGYVDELMDGPHSDRSGVEKAAYLIGQLGLRRGRKFACVRVEQTPVTPLPHDTDHASLQFCRQMIDWACGDHGIS